MEGIKMAVLEAAREVLAEWAKVSNDLRTCRGVHHRLEGTARLLNAGRIAELERRQKLLMSQVNERQADINALLAD